MQQIFADKIPIHLSDQPDPRSSFRADLSNSRSEIPLPLGDG